MVPAPALSLEQERALLKARERVEKDPNLFNGPIWHLQGSTIFKATFDWLLAETKMPGEGPLGAALILRLGGKILWQKRGGTVLSPGLWDLSAAGTMDVPDPKEVIVREAEEEIGITLKPELLGLWKDTKSGFFLFEAEWGGEEIIVGEEVEETLWAEAPPGPMVSRWEDFFASIEEKK